MNDEDTTIMPLNVLLVDNDPDHAAAMAESLERIGFVCTLATTGPEGAKLVDEKNWDIIVTDLVCLLYTSPSPRDLSTSRMPSSA